MSTPTPFQKFAETMLHMDSEYIPKILQSMISEQQAELLMALPGTVAQMAGKLGRPADAVGSDLKDMFRKGLTFKKLKGEEAIWRGPAHLPQFHDGTIVWPEATPEFYRLWKDYMEIEWPKLAPVLAQFMPRPYTRVIPVDKSLEAGRAQVLAPENVRSIVASATRLAVTKCTCRLTMQKCAAPIDVCLQVDRAAEYTIERGSGRELTREEALRIIEETEEAGLVHVTMNKTSVGHFICNCCGCCCQSFTLLISDGLPLCDPSRYCPRITAETCTGCGACAERCWFGAIAVNGDGVAAVIDDKCLGCGQCAVGCPEEAIAMSAVRAPEFIPQ
jgi:Pyruvate/2-oxoacid:ferredoxin oxidoreductase delta subunit